MSSVNIRAVLIARWIVSMLEHRSILVTGATGSFGRHFIKTVFEKDKPRRLVVFSRDEQKQFEMKQTFPE